MSWRRYGIAGIAGIAMAIVVDLIDRGFVALGLHAETTRIDDILIGLVAAALVLFVQRQQVRELRRQQQSAAVIEQMNHHIRNALQVIVARASLEQETKPELRQIDDAVARIDWALREILPRSASDEPVPEIEPQRRASATPSH